MTKIKLCGLSRPCDVAAANALSPEYIGFVFVPGSRRYVSPEAAGALRKLLRPGIQAVGVFADAAPELSAELLRRGIIDAVQLHGGEDAAYIRRLRTLTAKPLIQAFRIACERDAAAAQNSTADYVLLDSGGGTGKAFDWGLITYIKRPFFLAGGLDAHNVGHAVTALRPYAVDVSSGIEIDGWKDQNKMTEFVHAVRGVRGEDAL